jgi:hypothetical protein
MTTDAEQPRSRDDWPVRARHRDNEDDGKPTTAQQRLAMMWELATQAWAMAGIDLPAYDRANAPIRARRLSGADE